MYKVNIKKIFGGFYSPLRLVSTGKPLLFSVGSRSIGKSTGWAIFLLWDFLRHGREFIYARRNDDELRRTCADYFSDAVKILNAHANKKIKNMRYFRGEYFVQLEGDEEERRCGYAIALSAESKYKSGHYSGVGWIVYDEFIATDRTRYLGRQEYPEFEYDCLIRLYQTVDRGIGRAFRNETRIICMGNAITLACPPFLALGIDRLLKPEMELLNPRAEVWCVEQTREVEATRGVKDSFAYRMSSAAQREKNYENCSGEGSSPMIKTLHGVAQGLFTMTWRGHRMGAYVTREGQVYICNRPTKGLELAMSCGDQDRVNRPMAESMQGRPYFKLVKEAVLRGLCVFQDMRCYSEVLTYFRML